MHLIFGPGCGLLVCHPLFAIDDSYIDTTLLRDSAFPATLAGMVVFYCRSNHVSMSLQKEPQTKKPNRLLHENSPYLLQHAYTPVDWYPWGEEAFEKARRDLKPFFGATCIPPADRYGRPGFPQILERIHGVWTSDRKQVLDAGQRIGEYLNRLSNPGTQSVDA